MLNLIEELNINLFISFYMNGLCANFTVIDGQPKFLIQQSHRVMGMYFGDNAGWTADYSGITAYRRIDYTPTAKAFRPTFKYFMGYIDSHELVVSRGLPIVNATLFDCLAIPDPNLEVDFNVIHRPPFVQNDRQAIDQHHINGIALEGDRLAYLTAFSSQADGTTKKLWKDYRKEGILYDVAKEKIVANDLFIPHSPRIDGEYLYVCNSGTGEVFRYRFGKKESVNLGCFTRGIRFTDDYIFVGGSKIREKKNNLIKPEMYENNKCCLSIIDKRTFKLLGQINFNDYCEAEEDILTEIFDFWIFPQDQVVFTGDAQDYKFFHNL